MNINNIEVKTSSIIIATYVSNLVNVSILSLPTNMIIKTGFICLVHSHDYIDWNYYVR